jgi:hypothetical protein
MKCATSAMLSLTRKLWLGEKSKEASTDKTGLNISVKNACLQSKSDREDDTFSSCKTSACIAKELVLDC